MDARQRRAEVVAELLVASDLHVVASRPYPIARSTLEAMAAGALVLAWDSAPIQEVIEPGTHGLIVPGNDPEAALHAALSALDDPDGHQPLTEAAAVLVQERYDREVTMPRLAEWLGIMAESTSPVGRARLASPQ